MHPALLHTHNAMRWVILVAGVFTLLKAFQGLKGDRDYAAARRAGVILMASLHLQLILGLLLFVVSPFIQLAMGDMAATMKDSGTRFFVAEHPVLMVIAVIVATIGSIVSKNAPNDAAKHRKLLVFTVVTFVLLLGGIPWQRPLFPGMGG